MQSLATSSFGKCWAPAKVPWLLPVELAPAMAEKNLAKNSGLQLTLDSWKPAYGKTYAYRNSRGRCLENAFALSAIIAKAMLSSSIESPSTDTAGGKKSRSNSGMWFSSHSFEAHHLRNASCGAPFVSVHLNVVPLLPTLEHEHALRCSSIQSGYKGIMAKSFEIIGDPIG